MIARNDTPFTMTQENMQLSKVDYIRHSDSHRETGYSEFFEVLAYFAYQIFEDSGLSPGDNECQVAARDARCKRDSSQCLTQSWFVGCLLIYNQGIS